MIYLSLLFAAFNRARGDDWGKPYTGRGVMAALFGLAAWLHTPDLGVFLIVTVGMLLWALFGWGEYFDFSKKVNHEIRWIDALVGMFIRPGQYNDMVCMCIRGMFVYPMFAALALYGYTDAWVYGFVGALQGIVYWVCWRLLYCFAYTDMAELLMGALLGLAVQCVLAGGM